jgi:hypothetical protein
MRKRYLALVPVLLLAAWGPVWSGGASDGPARALEMPEPAFQRPVVNVLESHPVQFVLVFEQTMPTPGWTSTVDSVDVDGEAGRIVVRITQKAPEGIVAQVITPTKLRVPLGSLPRGRYVLELRTRRDEASGFQPVHALVVSAS